MIHYFTYGKRALKHIFICHKLITAQKVRQSLMKKGFKTSPVHSRDQPLMVKGTIIIKRPY